MKLNLKNIIKSAIGSLVAVLFIITGSAAIAADNTVSVQSVSGFVTTVTEDGEKKRIEAGDHLSDGEIVYTGENSSVLLLLENGQTISLGSLSSYTIGEKIVGNGISGGSGGVSSTPASPTLSTATSAGGGIIADDGGSPIN